MSEKKRIEWVDAAKGIALLAVILGHIVQGVSFDQSQAFGVATWPVLTELYSWDLPVFFIISGYLFSGSKYNFKDFLARKAKSLLIPYLIMGIITIVLSWLFMDFGNYSVILKDYVLVLILQNRYNTIWYLTCIFVAEIVFYLIMKVCKNKRLIMTIMVAILVTLGLIYYRLGGKPLPWNVDVVPFACMFMMVGYIAKAMDFSYKKIIFIIALILNPFLAFLNYRITGKHLEMFNCSYTFLPLTLIAAVAGAYAVIRIGAHFHPKWLTYIGQNSLIYFGLHQVICIPVWEGLCMSTGLFMKASFLNAVLYNVCGLLFTLLLMTILVVINNKWKARKAR